MANNQNMNKKIKKAIVSLSDKSDIKLILKVLKKYNIKIILICDLSERDIIALLIFLLISY